MPGPRRWLLGLFFALGCSSSGSAVRSVPAEVEWPDAAIAPDFRAASPGADAGPPLDSAVAP